jgi:hypothetical protein
MRRRSLAETSVSSPGLPRSPFNVVPRPSLDSLDLRGTNGLDPITALVRGRNHRAGAWTQSPRWCVDAITSGSARSSARAARSRLRNDFSSWSSKTTFDRGRAFERRRDSLALRGPSTPQKLLQAGCDSSFITSSRVPRTDGRRERRPSALGLSNPDSPLWSPRRAPATSPDIT